MAVARSLVWRGLERLLVQGSGLLWDLALWLLRRCYAHRMDSCQQCLHTCLYLGHVYQMTEGRLCQVHLLDNRKLELLVQPKLLSRELLDLVSSHFNLKEKQYFGLTFIDDTGQCKWLQLDRRVLEHDFSKKSGPISLNFLVRFYIENISLLKDTTTVELFFLNAKTAIYNGDIEVESEVVFKLAAHALQEAKGDFTSDETTRADLKKLPTLPTKVLKEHPSLAYCEERVMQHYKQLQGLSRGQAIVQYLALVESLPTYGLHYYEVKDKQGIPWWLGISYKGIGQYDLQDKVKPRKLFQWKQLENLYFREKKFAVEVNDPHRTVSKRTFGQTGLVIHTWYASHSLIKTIWAMAISQHQFYLERKQSKAKMSAARSLNDIALDLTDNGASKVSKGHLGIKNQLIMASNGSLGSTGSADSEMNDDQKKEKISELKKKEKDIQDILTQKMKELKKICLREAELTGKLPKDYPLSAGEKPPQVRRRVGTAFKLDELFPYNEDPYLRNLESRFALQRKIVEAAKKLAGEQDLNKTVKKKRRRNCLDAMQKLQQIEDEMNQYRIKQGKKPTQRASLIIADELVASECSSLSDGAPLDDDDSDGVQRPRSRSVQCSPYLGSPPSAGLDFDPERRASASDQPQDRRLDYDLHYYGSREVSSTHSSPYKTMPRHPRDGRMPHTPLMTRNAYSSSQLRSEGSTTHQPCFRHRSNSLESQSHLLLLRGGGGGAENGTSCSASDKHHHHGCSSSSSSFSLLLPARRSTSSEALEDCASSYTSLSSADYAHYRAINAAAAAAAFDPRLYDYRHHRKVEVYGNTGSMPNLVHSNSNSGGGGGVGNAGGGGGGYAYPPLSMQYGPTAYYVAGYPCSDFDAYSNGGYVYENELEGHYNVNPSYHPHGGYPTAASGAAHHGHYRHYGGMDGHDTLPQNNPYATMRPPRGRQGPRNELMLAKNMQKALVVEHLRGWYHRSAVHRDMGVGVGMGHRGGPLAAYEGFDRGSQHSLGYQTLPAAPFSHSSRTASYSSVSSAASGGGSWRSHLAVGLTDSEMDTPLTTQPTYSGAPFNRSPTHTRYATEPRRAESLSSEAEMGGATARCPEEEH